MSALGVLLLVMLAVLVAGLVVAWEASDEMGTIPPVSITCAEDMACWDCSTMGNGRCGP